MISFNKEQLFLVTGASSGIGRACALLVNELGGSVIGVGRNEAELINTKQQCINPDIFHIATKDLTNNPNTISTWVKELKEKHGNFSGLVSCAGKMYMDSLREYSFELAEKTSLLHLHIPVLLAKALADKRNCVGAGTSLVFIAALGGVIPQPGLLTYGAAKSALIFVTQNISKELANKKIRVNSISPALVRTAMTERDYSILMGYDVLAKEESQYPLGIGTPEDIANMAVFLLSNKAKWITGQNITMSGGRY